MKKYLIIVQKNIEFLSSAFTNHDLEYLFNLGIKRIKVPSGEITNLPYLEKTATFGIPIIFQQECLLSKKLRLHIKHLLNLVLKKIAYIFTLYFKLSNKT